MRNDICLRFVVVLGLAGLLVGCGNPVECNRPGIDGTALISSIKDGSAPLEKIASDAATLGVACKLTENERRLVGKIVSRVATSNDPRLQFQFYSAMSDDSHSDIDFRLQFIRESSLVSGALNSAADALKPVDFDGLGSPLDFDNVKPELRAAIRQLRRSITSPADPNDDLRKVQIGDKNFVAVRSTFNGDMYSEWSEIRFLNLENMAPLTGLASSAGLVDLDEKPDALVDYFFGCSSRAGPPCGVQDSRLIVDQAGKLKYVLSILEKESDEIQNRQCIRKVLVMKATTDGFKNIGAFGLDEEVDCQNSHVPDSHGESISSDLERKFVDLLSKHGDEPDLARLVNFERRDAADDELRRRLLAGDGYWKRSFAARFVEKAEPVEAKAANLEEFLASVIERGNSATSRLESFAWTFRDVPSYQTEIVTSRELNELVKDILDALSAKKFPPEPKKPEGNGLKRLNVVILREVSPQDEVIMTMPYTYVCVEHTRSPMTPCVVGSDKPLADRKQAVFLRVLAASKPAKHRIGDFTQDVWYYKVPNDKELEAANRYESEMSHYESVVRTRAEWPVTVGKEIRYLNGQLLLVEKSINQLYKRLLSR